jgi:hypothetical protein
LFCLFAKCQFSYKSPGLAGQASSSTTSSHSLLGQAIASLDNQSTTQIDNLGHALTMPLSKIAAAVAF